MVGPAVPLVSSRRALRVTFERSFRLLACEIHLTTDCDRFLARFESMTQRAVQNHPISRRHLFQVWRHGDRYRVWQDGQECEEAEGARATAETVFRRIQDLTLEALPEFTKLHAGCATKDGRRLVAVGPSHSGKSTLMARLLYEGFAVHCDDIVLLRGGEVLPYPRRFWIRPPTFGLIPQLAALASARPAGDEDDELVLDPSEQGFEWRVEPGPVDVVLFLEPALEGETRLEPSPKHAMASRVMAQSSLPAAGARQWIGDVISMLDRAECYVLHWRALEPSVRLVAGVMRGDQTGGPHVPAMRSTAGGHR